MTINLDRRVLLGATFSGMIAGFPVLSLAQEAAPSAPSKATPPPLSAYARNPK